MRAVLALAVLTAASSAHAAPVNVDFRVGVTSGPLAGETLVGSFGFDDTALVDGVGVDVPLSALTLSFGGASFGAADAGLVFIDVQGRTVRDLILGGAPSGFDQIDAGDAQADFLLGAFDFAYKLPGADQFIFDGVVEFISAPAPATIALFGLGLLGLARRR